MKFTKEQVEQFILDELELSNFSLNEFSVDFSVRGLCFEPSIFICPTEAGLSFGYYGVIWEEPYMPIITKFTHHVLSWELFDDLDDNSKRKEIIESVFRVIDFRKGQYQKWEFCGKKVPPEHRFEEYVCHGCASREFGVVY